MEANISDLEIDYDSQPKEEEEIRLNLYLVIATGVSLLAMGFGTIWAGLQSISGEIKNLNKSIKEINCTLLHFQEQVKRK